MRYLNLGCGNRFCNDPEWINIDFNSVYDNVKSINILKGLPFADESVDAVFSSCMLEHLTKDQAQRHLKECFRVLRPGGGMQNRGSRPRKCVQRISEDIGVRAK